MKKKSVMPGKKGHTKPPKGMDTVGGKSLPDEAYMKKKAKRGK